jgi:hypothetical protein
VVREREIVFETATYGSLRRERRQIVKNKVHGIPPSVLLIL